MQHRLQHEWLNLRGWFERRASVKNYSRRKLLFPPVFIVGVPRCGSTYLYQLITHFFPCMYFSNYMADRYQIPVAAARRQKARWGNTRHGSFTSDYGETNHPLGPSEAGYFWYQWFPETEHYAPAGLLDEKSKREIRSVIAAITSESGKPVVFKNLMNSVRLGALLEIFPEMLVIHLRRNPLDTALSIYKARMDLNGNLRPWLSVKPKEYKTLESLAPEKQIAGQVYYVTRQIVSDIAAMKSSRVMSVTYEWLCENPVSAMKQLNEFFLNNGLPTSDKDYFSLMPHVTPFRQHADSSIFGLLKNAVEELFNKR
jgi:hypothetical protein